MRTVGGRLTSPHVIDKHSEISRRHLPDAAAVYCLLGKLWHSFDDIKKAVDCYVEALKLNPFMWDAFLGLCSTGRCIACPSYFTLPMNLQAPAFGYRTFSR